MPELPDITAYITALQQRVLGQTLERVRLGSVFLLRSVEPPLSSTVVDETGLSGRYDFNLKWTPDESQLSGLQAAEPPDPNGPPGLYTAIQEQLGLKIESKKAPVDVLVIDRLDEPSAN